MLQDNWPLVVKTACEERPGDDFRSKQVKETRQLNATCGFEFPFVIKGIIGTIDENRIMSVNENNIVNMESVPIS